MTARSLPRIQVQKYAGACSTAEPQTILWEYIHSFIRLPETRAKIAIQRVGKNLGREISAQSIFFHEAVARNVGLNATDTRCLNLIGRSGGAQVTAGELAKATGLTTGAVTGITVSWRRTWRC